MTEIPMPKLNTGHAKGTMTASYNGCEILFICATDEWSAWFSYTDSERGRRSWMFDQGGKDPRGSKYDRRKGMDLTIAQVRRLWSESLAQSFVWQAIRHSVPFTDGWPEADDIVLVRSN